ncbi:TPA: hypothetical protein ACPZSL_002723, partial [Yersinia enterocolitica]
MSLIRGSPYGPAQALFKVVYNQFVSHLPPSCNSNYLEYKLREKKRAAKAALRLLTKYWLRREQADRKDAVNTS